MANLCSCFYVRNYLNNGKNSATLVSDKKWDVADNFINYCLNDLKKLTNILHSRGESAAFGRRMPWANRLFSKSMKGKFLNFLHEIEKMISVISVQV